MSDPAQHSRIVLQKYKQEEGEHREFTFISQLLASPYRLLFTASTDWLKKYNWVICLLY